MANWNINNDLVSGNNMLLYVADIPQSGDPTYRVIAYGKSNGLSLSQDSAESSSKFSCAWRANQATRIGYEITADALYCTNNTDAASFDALVAKMVAQKNIAWAMGQAAAHIGTDGNPLPCDTNPFTLDQSKDFYNGVGIITSLDLTANEDESASISISIQGSGEILKNGSPITIGTL